MLLQFWQFCLSKKDFNLYYFFLNEVEIQHFANNHLTLTTPSKITNQEHIKAMLKGWSSKNWSLEVNTTQDITNYKQKKISEISQSESFTNIKKYFSSAVISDIVIKQ